MRWPYWLALGNLNVAHCIQPFTAIQRGYLLCCRMEHDHKYGSYPVESVMGGD